MPRRRRGRRRRRRTNNPSSHHRQQKQKQSQAVPRSGATTPISVAWSPLCLNVQDVSTNCNPTQQQQQKHRQHQQHRQQKLNSDNHTHHVGPLYKGASNIEEDSVRLSLGIINRVPNAIFRSCQTDKPNTLFYLYISPPPSPRTDPLFSMCNGPIQRASFPCVSVTARYQPGVNRRDPFCRRAVSSPLCSGYCPHRTVRLQSPAPP